MLGILIIKKELDKNAVALAQLQSFKANSKAYSTVAELEEQIKQGFISGLLSIHDGFSKTLPYRYKNETHLSSYTFPQEVLAKEIEII